MQGVLDRTMPALSLVCSPPPHPCAAAVCMRPQGCSAACIASEAKWRHAAPCAPCHPMPHCCGRQRRSRPCKRACASAPAAGEQHACAMPCNLSLSAASDCARGARDSSPAQAHLDVGQDVALNSGALLQEIDHGVLNLLQTHTCSCDLKGRWSCCEPGALLQRGGACLTTSPMSSWGISSVDIYELTNMQHPCQLADTLHGANTTRERSCGRGSHEEGGSPSAGPRSSPPAASGPVAAPLHGSRLIACSKKHAMLSDESLYTFKAHSVHTVHTADSQRLQAVGDRQQCAQPCPWAKRSKVERRLQPLLHLGSCKVMQL